MPRPDEKRLAEFRVFLARVPQAMKATVERTQTRCGGRFPPRIVSPTFRPGQWRGQAWTALPSPRRCPRIVTFRRAGRTAGAATSQKFQNLENKQSLISHFHLGKLFREPTLRD